MNKASTDVTYCINKECKDKCWRHISKYRLEKDEYYWYIKGCDNIKELKVRKT